MSCPPNEQTRRWQRGEAGLISSGKGQIKRQPHNQFRGKEAEGAVSPQLSLPIR